MDAVTGAVQRGERRMNELPLNDVIEILLSEKKKSDAKLEKAYDSYCLFPNEKDQIDWETYSALSTALDMAIKALKQPEPCEAGAQMSLPECEDVPDINVGKMDDDKLDEAIRHEDRAAERYSDAYNQFHNNVDPADAEVCLNNIAIHRRYASWLRELKAVRDLFDNAYDFDEIMVISVKEKMKKARKRDDT